MQQWQEVEPGKYKSQSAMAEMRDEPERMLVTFIGPIEPAEALHLVRSAALDFGLECPVHIAAAGSRELIAQLGNHLGLCSEVDGEVMVFVVPPE
ncbi:MAG: hypothetical protein GXY83_40440 [Rhodopirellula sp.]|nr:hypothetical protein [Rhodopirellula sp.]